MEISYTKYFNPFVTHRLCSLCMKFTCLSFQNIFYCQNGSCNANVCDFESGTTSLCWTSGFCYVCLLIGSQIHNYYTCLCLQGWTCQHINCDITLQVLVYKCFTPYEVVRLPVFIRHHFLCASIIPSPMLYARRLALRQSVYHAHGCEAIGIPCSWMWGNRYTMRLV